MLLLKHIKEIRKAKGVSQKQMAEKLNISQPAYQKIESGEIVLGIERFLAICKILDIKSYNQILPAINIDASEEITKVLISGSMAFEIIHKNAMHTIKLVDELSAKIAVYHKNTNEDTIKDLEFVISYLKIISGESMKNEYKFREIQNLMESID